MTTNQYKIDPVKRKGKLDQCRFYKHFPKPQGNRSDMELVTLTLNFLFTILLCSNLHIV